MPINNKNTQKTPLDPDNLVTLKQFQKAPIIMHFKGSPDENSLLELVETGSPIIKELYEDLCIKVLIPDGNRASKASNVILNENQKLKAPIANAEHLTRFDNQLLELHYKGGKFYVVNPTNNFNTFNLIDISNPEGDTWELIEPSVQTITRLYDGLSFIVSPVRFKSMDRIKVRINRTIEAEIFHWGTRTEGILVPGQSVLVSYYENRLRVHHLSGSTGENFNEAGGNKDFNAFVNPTKGWMDTSVMNNRPNDDERFTALQGVFEVFVGIDGKGVQRFTYSFGYVAEQKHYLHKHSPGYWQAVTGKYNTISRSFQISISSSVSASSSPLMEPGLEGAQLISAATDSNKDSGAVKVEPKYEFSEWQVEGKADREELKQELLKEISKEMNKKINKCK